GFRNEVHLKPIALHLTNGEAGPVEADIALAENVGRPGLGNFQGEGYVILWPVNGDDTGLRVDMARQQVAANLITDAGGALEIHRIAFLERGQVSDGERLLHDIELCRIVFDTGDSQAGAVDGDTRTD